MPEPTSVRESPIENPPASATEIRRFFQELADKYGTTPGGVIPGLIQEDISIEQALGIIPDRDATFVNRRQIIRNGLQSLIGPMLNRDSSALQKAESIVNVIITSRDTTQKREKLNNDKTEFSLALGILQRAEEADQIQSPIESLRKKVESIDRELTPLEERSRQLSSLKAGIIKERTASSST